MNITIEHSEGVQEILNYHGVEAQELKTIEELAELQRAIARKDLKNIEEEIADVLIMITQLMLRKDINIGNIKESMEYKINRELKRINAVG
ncbi:MazG nucleotide pyrophosphohydrolase domain-containing protein [Eubacterium multiforme]|uniref:NTP pyrophosphatase (Non-canonical NTP hydrolase) n=1 Tax=Eubacterium multiforme TaxID=83339 RepID=A0ABT9UWA3_9FIRM|nr:MazG nucleotide pyrophosphohydrolase domain-containing protein [Eubacterium multiforme]MDQ0150589.1 NTP pyrophosphatase (non-canonical NTP hydrolase) [Eubacterium multiforme]